MTFLKENCFYEKTKIIVEDNPTQQDFYSSNSGISFNFADVTYSFIDYIPSEFSKYVIYDFIFGCKEFSSREPQLLLKLQYSEDEGSSWSDWGDNTEVFIGTTTNYTRLHRCRSIRFCLKVDGNTAVSRTKWQKSRRLKLIGKPIYAGSGDVGIRIHETGYINPSVSCYSISE